MTTLYKKGYALLKENMTDEDYARIENDLIVKPYSYISKDTESFKLYRESTSKIYLPKFYAKNVFGQPTEYKIPLGKTISIKFNGSLRPIQETIVNKYKDTISENDNFDKSNGGIIVLQCGGGKTVIGLNIISVVQKKTLIIVHKTFLMDQWRERMEQFLPGVKLGYIQGKTIDIEGKDIVLGMLQSISMKDYDSSVFKDFGLCIIDEVHHIAAETFSKALHKINCHCMLGLSATPKRKDGLSKVFEHFIGDYVYKQTEKETRKVNVNMIQLDNRYSYCREIHNYNKQLNMPRMITNICEFEGRTNLIIELIKIIIKDHSRQILVLSDRKSQLGELYKIISTNKICSVGYYVGGMKELDLKMSESKRLILGTYAMSSEGMDIPSLNTLIFASPKSDIQQSVGRILRKVTDTIPTIYDIVDNFSMFANQATKRIKYYHKSNCDVYSMKTILYQNFRLNDEDMIKIEPNTKGRPKKKDPPINLDNYAFVE